MADHTGDSEIRLSDEWQKHVPRTLDQLKESIEKIELDRATRRDYEALYNKVARLQTTVDDLPGVIHRAITTAYEKTEASFNQRLSDIGVLDLHSIAQTAITKAYEKAEGSFNQRLSDIGVFDLRCKVETLQTDIATQKEATSSLKETALRYGLLGGGLPAGLMILAAILYFLLTGKVPPV